MWNRKAVLGWSAVLTLALASAGWAASSKPKGKTGKAATVAPAAATPAEVAAAPAPAIPAQPSDQALSEQISAAFKADPLLDGQAIQVEAKAGNITLRGEVASDVQLNHALDLAGAIPGVRAVENAMLVKS